MWNVGDKVLWWTWSDEGEEIAVAATITDTFYEPGDPVQAVCIITDDGDRYGGLDSQDFTPLNRKENG